MLNEFMFDAALAVIAVTVPLATGYGMKLLNQFLSRFISESLADEITGRLEDAVAFANQTYVDALKDAGSFGAEAQAHAFKLALTTLLNNLSPEAKSYIEKNFGNAETYLTSRIEAEVKRQKLAA